MTGHVDLVDCSVAEVDYEASVFHDLGYILVLI